MEKICIYCNKKFTTTHSNKKHCSSEKCKKSYHYDKFYIKKTCTVCNSEFICRRSKIKTYCSKKCAQSSIIVKNKIIESQKNTYIKKYGVSHPMKTIEVKNNFKNAMMMRYGVTSPLKNNNIYNRHKKTKQLLYGNNKYCNSNLS